MTGFHQGWRRADYIRLTHSGPRFTTLTTCIKSHTA
ncbi:MAG: hypothetical protein QOF36_2321, partial [Microbacteriaceae bacterium]|nr:hypothetical protein [Microbacteriaceae bacterium]